MKKQKITIIILVLKQLWGGIFYLKHRDGNVTNAKI